MIDIDNLTLRQGAFQLTDVSFHVPKGKYALLMGKTGGGKTKPIALGRALANHPPILLMDEPLSSLDEETRDVMIDLLKSLPQRANVTVLHVTHSRHEADQLGDWVFRLHDGKIEVIKAE